MNNRKPHKRKLTLFTAWILKAAGLVIAGATITIVAVTITKAISIKPDSPQAGKFVGVRHEAATIPATDDTPTAVWTPGLNQDQEASSKTVLRNGITVVSPPLLVPEIDATSLQATNGSNDSASSASSSNARKHSRYASRTRSHRRTLWKAYGFAIR